MAYEARLAISDLTATTRYLLIDKSDSTNYAHTRVGDIELLQLEGIATVTTGGAWRVKVGLLTENDGTNGSVYWLFYADIPTTGSLSISEDYRIRGRLGLLMDIASDKPVSWCTNKSQLASTNWQTTDTFTNATGSTTATAAAGDIMVEVEEVTDGGTLDLMLRANYNTRTA